MPHSQDPESDPTASSSGNSTTPTTGTTAHTATSSEEQPTAHAQEHAQQSQQERPEPPVSQLQDVPPEEWSYWTAQAWAGCGVVFALLLAMFLPLILSAVMGNTTGKVVGFGISGFIGLVSVAVISRLTYQKRQERRETMRLALAERRAAPRDTPEDRNA